MPRLSEATFATARRRGFTLTETLVVLLILAIVGTALFRVLVKQQQSYSDSSRQAAMQREIRLTSSFVPPEFRALSSAGGDVIAMHEDRVEFLANIGSAIICEKQGNNHVIAPPLHAAGVTMTNWFAQPVAGDSIFLYNDSLEKGADDDTWTRRVINTVDNLGGGCPGAPYTDPVRDAGKPRWRFGIQGGVPDSVRVGAVIRFARPLRYRAFQANSGKWYLGVEQYQNGAWSTIEAVGGPFRPFQAGDANPSGVQFRYYDSLGVRLTSTSDRLRVSRIDLYLRTNAGAASVTERRTNDIRDSVMMRIAVRNFR